MTSALGNVNVAPGGVVHTPHSTNVELLASTVAWSQDGVTLAVGNGVLEVGTPLARFDDGFYGPLAGSEVVDRLVGNAAGATAGTFTTSAAHGLAAGDSVKFSNVAGGLTGVTAGTTYFVIASGLTPTVFKVSTTAGGSAVTISAAGTADVTQVGAGESVTIVGFLRRQVDTGVEGDIPKFGNRVYRGTLKYSLIKAANGAVDLTGDQLTALGARVDTNRDYLIF